MAEHGLRKAAGAYLPEARRESAGTFKGVDPRMESVQGVVRPPGPRARETTATPDVEGQAGEQDRDSLQLPAEKPAGRHGPIPRLPLSCLLVPSPWPNPGQSPESKGTWVIQPSEFSPVPWEGTDGNIG